MKNIRNTFSVRILSLILAMSVLAGILPQTSVSATTDTEIQEQVAEQGEISVLVDGGIVEGNTIIYSNSTELVWSSADSSVGRDTDGWHIGVKIIAPSTLELEKAKYQKWSGTVWTSEDGYLFKTNRTSQEEDEIQYINLWDTIDPEILNDAIAKGENIEYKYKFNWNGDEIFEQPITIQIDPTKIILKKDSDVVYPISAENATVEMITEGVNISGNGSNVITIETTSDIALSWMTKDPDYGISSDGWWIGYKIIAPEGYSDNASFQNKSSTGWGETKSFVSNKNTENTVDVWENINDRYLNVGVSNNTNLIYITRYDWDGDNVYEQIIQVRVIPSKIKLISENGEQVFPYLGSIVALTSGTVSGNSSNLELKIDEVTLNWEEKDEKIGKNTDGWWVGIRIIAPAGFSSEQLQKVTYKYRDNNDNNDWNEFSSTQKFWENKSSKESDTVCYIDIWKALNPSLIKKYSINGNNLISEFVFDWDGNGEGDQTITFLVLPNDKIILNKVEQNGFAFVEPNPLDKWVGETYTNTAFGGNGMGNITYAITDGFDVADIDSSTGKLTFKKTGTVVVTATKEADDVYSQATATYTVKAIKYPQSEFKFENSNDNIVIGFDEGSFTNIATGGSGDGKVEYTIISDSDVASIDKDTGTVTFFKAGQVIVKATKAADNNYNETTVTYILTIEKSNQDELFFASTVPTTIIYNKEIQNILSVSGGSGNGLLIYTIIAGNDYATIDPNTGAITTIKAGGSFTVQVYKTGNDGFNKSNAINATIYVDHAEQTDFVFEKQNQVILTYNDNNNIFTNSAFGGESTEKVLYSFADDDSDRIADINENTGEISILAAGTINVVATKAGDNCYKEAKTTYSIIVNKDTPEFEVKNVELVYGVTEYQVEVVSKIGGSERYRYSIDGKNNIGASIDKNSGKIILTNSKNKVGTIKIIVEREEDDCYTSISKSFELTIKYPQFDVMPTVDGEKNNDSGWYTDNVVIKAPYGYSIAYDNELDTVWASEISFVEEGINDVTVYMKSSDGYITDGIVISNLKIDKGNPDERTIAITYETPPMWEKFIENITFGIYKSDTLCVNLKGTDTISGIASLTYNLGGEDVVIPFNGEKSVSHSFFINAQYRNKIVLTATDVAGRKTQINSAHTIILDTENAELDVSYEFISGQHRENNDILYTQGDVNIFFTITETNFDLSESPVVTVNDQLYSLIWTRIDNTDKWRAKLSLVDNGDYFVKVTFADTALNKMVDFEQTISIDNEKPVIAVSYSNNEARNDNNYKADRVANVKVLEHNFKADEVVLNVTAKDICGNNVEGYTYFDGTNGEKYVKEFYDYAKNPANWTREEDVWTLNTEGMKFVIDAIYSIKLEYTDLAENAETPYIANFVIDKTVAHSDEITIEYSTSIIDKILENITYGFYKANVQVKVTVKDHTAGIEYFEITYTQADGKNNSNKATYTTEKLTALQDENDKTVFTATHTIEAEARGNVSVNLVDKAGNANGRSEEYVVVADTIAPGLEYEWTFTDNQVREYNNIYYTKEETKLEFTITEANFDLSLKQATVPEGQEETATSAPVLTVNGVAQDITWTQIEGTDKWETEITLSGNDDYVVELSYTDRSTNAMDTYTKEVHIDNEAPVFDVTYDNNNARNENNYKADRVATITVTEHNFKAEEVVLNVTAKDITGAIVDISSKGYAEYAKNPANWTQDGDVWTLNTDGMKFDIDAIYNITLNYTDLAENVATKYATEFVLDKTNPANIEIKYSSHVKVWEKVLSAVTFGYYSYGDEVTVTLIADDISSGVDFFTWSYTQEKNTSSINKTDDTQVISKENITYSNNGKTATASFVINAQARGNISVDVTDQAGNTRGKDDITRINVVDNIAPTRTIEFSDTRVLDRATMTDIDTYVEGQDVILYYETEAKVTITVNEANFIYNDDDTSDVVVTLTKNGVDSTPIVSWTDESADVHVGTFTISGDGDYFVRVSYTDRSGNVMNNYESQEIRIDDTDPTITADCTSDASAVNVKYYKADRKAVITIFDHNFLADDVVAVVTAVDVQGNKIANADAICAEIAAYLKTRSSWTHVGDVHTAAITFDDDAQYTFKIDYKDIIGNTAKTYVANPFVVDHKGPTNLKIEYSESIADKIIETITFGFYKPEVTVTITADDITSGVDYFEWSYTKETGTSDKNTDAHGAKIPNGDIEYSNKGLSAKATYKVPANARGYITATAIDRAGNSTSKTDKNNITVVVDNIAPTISVNYEADSTDTKVQFTDDNQVTVKTFADAKHAYYNGDVTAKIVINEANFFEGVETKEGVIHNVAIKLTKTDDNGNKTVYEFLPTGADQKYEGATTKYITWTTCGDEHSFSINYVDSADYVLEIEYTDISTNDASISANDGNTVTKSYESKIVTVDKIAPVVDVKYSNEKVIHTIDGREYYDAEQTATITVKEHNFRADDFVATVVAQDIVKADVNVEDFRATLSDESKWTQNANTYTITIKYSVDANYSFDYEYKDLAQNTAATYDEDLFAIDKTAPKNLTVSYSQSVADKILETITFGYYNAKVTVTITAEDDTSGIHRFEYAYLKSEGVSSVNAELLKAAIEEAEFTVDDNKFTSIFEIPKDVLQSDNQFNGTVKFVAFDRAENNTEMADTRRVIIDNIAPTATITYNAPVRNANNISYYAGNIDAKIVINEANFYSEDVVVKVNDKVVAVKWVDDSVDIHTGTFTLTKDGDYIVTVEYEDRSDNEMTKYTSNRLTLDTKTPTVIVSNIDNNSANNDEKYSFTITADDTNLDATTFKPVLTAIIRKNDGSYGTKNVSLGEMRIVESGKKYLFSIDNLEEDAVYSLVCTVKDMSGNEYSKILLSDGIEYEEVRFSINRNGSTFAVDKNTATLVNQYYVYSVDEDIVIEEINTDPIENFIVKVNGKEIVENENYTTKMSDNDGEWSKRTYIINKNLFTTEGEYRIVVESIDKTETTAFSDVKNVNVSFAVDQTKPVLIISGLQEGGRYQVKEQIVTVIPTDDGGRLGSIKVIVFDSEGKPITDKSGQDISIRFDMRGEEFFTYLKENDDTVTFTIPEGLEYQVQIICNDCAVNKSGITNEYNETFKKVTVSQSMWIIFYANKPLFYGTIAGVIVILVGITFFVILKKRNKGKKQDKK